MTQEASKKDPLADILKKSEKAIEKIDEADKEALRAEEDVYEGLELVQPSLEECATFRQAVRLLAERSESINHVVKTTEPDTWLSAVLEDSSLDDATVAFLCKLNHRDSLQGKDPGDGVFEVDKRPTDPDEKPAKTRETVWAKEPSVPDQLFDRQRTRIVGYSIRLYNLADTTERAEFDKTMSEFATRKSAYRIVNKKILIEAEKQLAFLELEELEFMVLT